MAIKNSKLHLLNIHIQSKLSDWKIDDFLFVFVMWLLSRFVIMIGLQFIAPALQLSPVSFDSVGQDTLQIKNFTPHLGWELFTHWDGEHYRNIATKGYTYNADLVYDGYKYVSNQQYNIAFFPLYPLVVKISMLIGIPFEIAGTVISNISFLFALLIFHFWTNRLHSHSVAKWTTAVMAWFPMSLFCTLTYTESFFLLFTIAALSCFERCEYVGATFLGMLATATRPTGVVLIPTLLIFSWYERRHWRAYLSALLMTGGMVAFSLFCWQKFNEPLAFILAQAGWPQPSWPELLKDIGNSISAINLPDYVYAITAALLITIIGLLFYYPAWACLLLGIIVLPLSIFYVFLLQIIMPIFVVWLTWFSRKRINPILLIYGCCFLVFLFLTGTKASIHRHLYTMPSMSLGLGILFSQHPRAGYISIGVFGLILLIYSIKFAWWDWIA
jgi:Gpi18-like mannosyltransferase